jgi:hypothetical protein
MDENASQTRSENQRHQGGKTAGKEKRVNTHEGTIKSIQEKIASALESGQRTLGNTEGWRRVAELLEEARDDASRLTRGKCQESEKEELEGRGGIGKIILERIERLEKSVLRGQDTARPTPNHGGKKPLWSEVAAGTGNSKATIELRMTEMNGAVPETAKEKLEKIREVIPNARAIVQHPRAMDKVSVVATASTRDNILRNGLKEGTEGMRLIRRPIQAIVLGVPLTEPITSKNSVANQEWMKAIQKNSGITLTRVEWMYSQKRVDELRAGGLQKRGSVIVEMPTEHERTRIIRDGLVIGAEWYRVGLWDIAMKEVQCFRCWKWGHSQSVCNSPHELCGYCAGRHSTKQCETKTLEDASCAACKTKGHFAFWRKSCKTYDEFRRGREATRAHLEEATAQVHRASKEMTAPTLAFTQTNQWTMVEPKRTTGIKSKRTCKDDGDEDRDERRGPGRPRGTTAAAKARGQMIIRPITIQSTPASSQTIDSEANETSNPDDTGNSQSEMEIRPQMSQC